MAIKHRIEQLEKINPARSNVIDEWLEKYAEPFESEEERKEIYKVLKQYDKNMLAFRQNKLKKPPTLDIKMNQYPKLLSGILEYSEACGGAGGKA